MFNLGELEESESNIYNSCNVGSESATEEECFSFDVVSNSITSKEE